MLSNKQIHKTIMIATLRAEAPEFVEACNNKETDIVLMHQDAFAVDYGTNELTLLGMAIKYAGLKGKRIEII